MKCVITLASTFMALPEMFAIIKVHYSLHLVDTMKKCDLSNDTIVWSSVNKSDKDSE